VAASLVGPGNVVGTRSWFSAGARHRRRWAPRPPGPQPALAGRALDPRVHGHPRWYAPRIAPVKPHAL